MRLLKKWLILPATRDELHYETLLKLFFSGDIEKTEVLKPIERFEDNIKSELSLLQKYADQLSGFLENEQHMYYYLTITFGIETFQSYLKWCNATKKTINKRKVNNDGGNTNV